jgi:succinoglycan biosynthesis transport protein ExoP
VESRTLYESLLTRLKEAGVLAGLRSSNITVVDAARAPSKPAKPNVLLFLAGSLAGGLFLGTCGAFLRDTMDNKIQNLPELEAYLGETPLGILPFHEPIRKIKEPVTNYISDDRVGDEALQSSVGNLPAPLPALLLNARSSAAFTVISQPRSPYTEAVRALRTSLLLSRGGAPPQVILVTSSVPGEGKSMLSSNLAALLATQQGKKVLLVDGDLRRPVLHRRLNLDGDKGLSSILTDDNIQTSALSATIAIPDVPGLDVLPAGPVPPYPSELLGSDQMQEAVDCWRENYDFIVIDAAPVLPVTDSVILNTVADLTLVVARYRMTERQSLERSCRLLQTGSRKSKIGVVLNAVQRSANTYYQYYGYNNSSYYGNEKHA